ncbi:MAG TPA: hypothetical protein VJ952_12645 [Opitutales bacterium]|nr:hypothetical protein [Opitutales bacterium]
MRRAIQALMAREWAALFASRVVWIFAAACLAGGFAVTSGVGGAESAVWMALPLVLYLVPLLGLMAGVSAALGDAEEAPMLVPRAPGPLIRALVKWPLWAGLIALAALAWLAPATIRSGEADKLLQLWAMTAGEAAIFVALGLAIGRWAPGGNSAYLAALLFGFLFIAGAGVLGWVAARSDFFQENPQFWTLGLMAHPVEALRVGLMFSLETLPVDAERLPTLSRWWLAHSGLWYALLVLVWSSAALGFGALSREGV